MKISTASVFVLLFSMTLYGCTQAGTPTPTHAATVTLTQTPAIDTIGPSSTPTASPATPKATAQDSCRLMKHKNTGQVACFGCAGTVCTTAEPNFEPYVLPSGYIGIPYACFPTQSGCQLAQ